MFKFYSNPNKISKMSSSFWLFLVVLVFAFSGINAATFYSQVTGNFSTLSNWNTVAGGGGANPIAADLTSGVHNFIVKDGHTITINQDITVNQLTVGQGITGGTM